MMSTIIKNHIDLILYQLIRIEISHIANMNITTSKTISYSDIYKSFIDMGSYEQRYIMTNTKQRKVTNQYRYITYYLYYEIKVYKIVNFN